MGSAIVENGVKLDDIPLAPNEFITGDVIEQLKKFKLNCIKDDDVVRYIYEYSQRLLLKSMKLNESKETAYAISLADYSVIGPYWGMSHTIDIESMVKQFDDEDYVVIHNHPSGLTFSPRDLKVLIGKSSIRIMIALGNNGKIYILEKKDVLTDEQKIKIRKATYAYEEDNISVRECLEIITENGLNYQEY